MIIQHKGLTVELYDSILELPADRFQAYNRNVLLDAGIGSDLNGVSARIATIRRIADRDPEGVKREVDNLESAILFVVENASPEMASFVPLIRKIDGRLLTDDDMTEEGVTRTLAELNRGRLPVGRVKAFLAMVKKNFAVEFELVFPKMTDDPEVKEFYAKLKSRTSLVLKSIRTGAEELEQQIAIIDDFLLSKIDPKVHSGHDGVEVQSVKQFEGTCVLLQQYNVSPNPRKMTTLGFYQALEIIKEQVRKRAKK